MIIKLIKEQTQYCISLILKYDGTFKQLKIYYVLSKGMNGTDVTDRIYM
jgi:hypothetical protein